MSEYEYQVNEDTAECPYCKHSYTPEAENYDEQEREEECENCGKKYYIQQIYTIKHKTKPCCKLNITEHSIENGFCTTCGKYIPGGQKK